MDHRRGGHRRLLLKDYIIQTMREGKNGLDLYEVPMGYGKTRTVAQAINEYVGDPDHRRRIIFLTSLNKNLPEDELLAAFGGNEEEYRRNVLRVRSCFDEVIEKLEGLEVPEEFQTEAYHALLSAVQEYRQAVYEPGAGASNIKDLRDRVNKAERSMRKEIREMLERLYPDKDMRIGAIVVEPQYEWIKELYPAALIEYYPVVLMSMNMFLLQSAAIIEPSYAFLTSDLVRDAIVCIDEFDATRETIERQLIKDEMTNPERIMRYGEADKDGRLHTPEGIISYLAERATVIGVSASAEFRTVLGNYDLASLEQQLGDAYHLTPLELQTRIRAEMNEVWKPYRDGRVNICTEMVPSYDVSDVHDECMSFCNWIEYGKACGDLICNAAHDKFHRQRYCNIARAMHTFCKKGIGSMLYLGMSVPGPAKKNMDADVLREMFNIMLQDCGLNRDRGTEPLMSALQNLVFLCGDHYEEDRETLRRRLAAGERTMIVSTYQTIGAGQNLQYSVPDGVETVELVPCVDENDTRHFYKDIDAIYLADITHLTPNIYSGEDLTQEECIRVRRQIKALLNHGEIRTDEADAMLSMIEQPATERALDERHWIYWTPSMRAQVARDVMQAVGRICRTYRKSPEINIMVEERLLRRLDAVELSRHIIPPEVEAIVNLKREQSVRRCA